MPSIGPHNPALGEIYQRLYPEMRRPKPNQEAIAAALQAMQRLTMESDSEIAAEDATPGTSANLHACQVCGHRNREGNKFCGMCGLPIGTEPSKSPGPATPAFALPTLGFDDELLPQTPRPAKESLHSGEEDEVHPQAGAPPGTHHYHHHYHHHYFQGGHDSSSAPRPNAPESAREAVEHLLPDSNMQYRLARRRAGMGSLGRVRLVAIGEWRGGRVAREAKALLGSALHWVYPDRAPAEILYTAILRRAVRCPDPYVQMRGHWIVRRLSPHCSRIELASLRGPDTELRLLHAMGWETANIHLGSQSAIKEVRHHLSTLKPNWLYSAAKDMVKVVTHDWRVWAESGKA